MSDEMKKEYDLSKAERGKFYHPDAEFVIPVYLDEENLAYVESIAHEQETDISDVANQLIREAHDKRRTGT